MKTAAIVSKLWLLAAPALAVLALGSGACGPQFDPSNEIKTLRVLAVKKDKPYAQPGEAVKLQLLWHDPKGRPDAKLQRMFIGGCGKRTACEISCRRVPSGPGITSGRDSMRTWPGFTTAIMK